MPNETLTFGQPAVPVKKREQPYGGPFPRGKHGHRCKACGGNAVACYKSQCTKAAGVETCTWCRK